MLLSVVGVYIFRDNKNPQSKTNNLIATLSPTSVPSPVENSYEGIKSLNIQCGDLLFLTSKMITSGGDQDISYYDPSKPNILKQSSISTSSGFQTKTLKNPVFTKVNNTNYATLSFDGVDDNGYPLFPKYILLKKTNTAEYISFSTVDTNPEDTYMKAKITKQGSLNLAAENDLACNTTSGSVSQKECLNFITTFFGSVQRHK